MSSLTNKSPLSRILRKYSEFSEVADKILVSRNGKGFPCCSFKNEELQWLFDHINASEDAKKCLKNMGYKNVEFWLDSTKCIISL